MSIKNVENIDLKATRNAGKKCCEKFEIPLKLLRATLAKNHNIMNSSSIIQTNIASSEENSTQAFYLLNVAASIDAKEFFEYAATIGLADPDCETFLLEKYYYGKTEMEILYENFNGSRRFFEKTKRTAYEMMAHLSNVVEYRKEGD